MEEIPLDGAIIRPYVDLNLETLHNVRVSVALSLLVGTSLSLEELPRAAQRPDAHC